MCICPENRNKTHFSSYYEILRFSLRAHCFKIYILYQYYTFFFSSLCIHCNLFPLTTSLFLKLLSLSFFISPATFPIDVCYYCVHYFRILNYWLSAWTLYNTQHTVPRWNCTFCLISHDFPYHFCILSDTDTQWKLYQNTCWFCCRCVMLNYLNWTY